MKVIIIGAGLSGLCTAVALRKYVGDPNGENLDIKIYEKPYQDAFSVNDGKEERRRRLGAGLGLQSNGLRVLHDLDPALRNIVFASGFPCTHFNWRTSGDYLLGREYLNVLPISRPLLIDCLARFLPESIIKHKLVSKVILGNGKQPLVVFEDGSPGEAADLVIGADGVGSVVRRSIIGDSEAYQPQYSGICGVGGVLDVALPPRLVQDPCMVFFMGSTGSFGYSGLTQADKNKLLYWSIFDTALPNRGMKFDQEVLVKEMRNRHSDWTNPLIKTCLLQAAPDNVYPVFVMPELPQWGRDGCVLVGDAAHALPPRTGQGASQAFEDAQTLALLLAGTLGKHSVPEAVTKSITGLYNVRHERVYKMRAWAVKWKDPKMPMSIWKTWMLYAFIFIFVKVRRLMGVFERIDDWDAKAEVRKHLESFS